MRAKTAASTSAEYLRMRPPIAGVFSNHTPRKRGSGARPNAPTNFVLPDLEQLGRLIQSQVGRPGEVVHDGIYEAGRVRPVSGLWLTTSGVVGIVDRTAILDYHHADHPELRTFRPGRQLSIGFTGHYSAMAEKFGAAPVGVAAENLIVERDGLLAEDEIEAGVMIESATGRSPRLSGRRHARICNVTHEH